MTEEQQSSSVTKKKRGLFFPIAIAVVAIAVVGFIASRAGLDKALVKQQLDDFIAQSKERAAAQGRDINITYGELEVVGSFASKHVLVHDPVLTVKPLERKADQKKVDALMISTSSLAIYPKATDLSSLRIELPDPINVTPEEDPSKSLLKISSNVPPVVVVSKKTEGAVTYNEVEYQSPSQMDMVYLREQQGLGEEDKTPKVVPVYETLQLSMAQGSGFTSSFAADASGLGTSKVNFRDIVMTPQAAPEGALKLAEITGEWSNALNEKKLNLVRTTLKVGPVTSDNTAVPYLPLAFDLDATYEGAMFKTPESIAASQTQESTMVLKNLSFTSKDASLKATANFTASATDTLPVGTANIALTNAPLVLAELRKYNMLNDANAPLVGSVLQLITGQPLEQITDLTIPIERARGGSFKIGKTTFEELFAVFLKQAMQMRSGGAAPVPVIDGGASMEPPHVPQLPAPDAPKSTPIEVPDPSVRG